MLDVAPKSRDWNLNVGFCPEVSGLEFECWVLDFECWALDFRFCVLDFEL